MLMINWILLGMWIIILAASSIIKAYTGKKVKGLEGIKGMVVKGEEYKKGSIVGKFGE